MKTSVQKKLLFMLAMSTIVGCQSVYVKMVGSHSTVIVTGLSFFFLVLLIIVELKKNKYRIIGSLVIQCIKKSYQIMLPVGTIFLVNYLLPSRQVNSDFNLSSNLSIIFLLVVLFILFYFVFLIDKRNIIRFLCSLSTSVFLINCVSLAIYFFGPVLHLLQPTGDVMTSWGGNHFIVSYFNLFFVAQPGSYSYLSFGRNTAMFSEAPIYAYVLLCSILYELFIAKEPNNKRLLMAYVAIFTTASTIGILISLSALFLFFIFVKKSRPVTRAFIFVGTPIIAVALFIFAYRLLQEKMLTGHSFDVRQSSFSTSVGNWISRPFWGFGFKSEEIGNFSAQMSVFTQTLQDGGLLFLYYYFSPFIKKVFFSRRGTANVLIAIVLYIATISFTIVTYTTMSIAVVALVSASIGSSDSNLHNSRIKVI